MHWVVGGERSRDLSRRYNLLSVARTQLRGIGNEGAVVLAQGAFQSSIITPQPNLEIDARTSATDL